MNCNKYNYDKNSEFNDHLDTGLVIHALHLDILVCAS